MCTLLASRSADELLIPENVDVCVWMGSCSLNEPKC